MHCYYTTQLCTKSELKHIRLLNNCSIIKLVVKSFSNVTICPFSFFLNDIKLISFALCIMGWSKRSR